MSRARRDAHLGTKHRPRASMLAAGSVVFLLQFIHGTATRFVYDAAQYWDGALQLVSGGDVATAGVLNIRGTLTPLVYLPPAAVAGLLGEGSWTWLVLIWNALLAAALCAMILPQLAELIVPGHLVSHVWTCALLGGLLFALFARFALLDVWAFACAATAMLLISGRRSWWVYAVGGLFAAIAVDLRPSYLLPLILGMVVVLIAAARRIPLVAAGALIGALPQSIYNVFHGGSWLPVPTATSGLIGVQSAQAVYSIRYDTVLDPGRNPQQWYCDPSLASAVSSEPAPTTPLSVAGSLLTHVPESLWFGLKKIATALQWSWSTPYEPSPGDGTGAIAVVVALTTAIGAFGLLRAIWFGTSTSNRLIAGGLLAFWLGAAATLVLTTPETRFALPLVSVGVVGVTCGLTTPMTRSQRWTSALWLLAALSVCLLLLWAGARGLGYPVSPGPLTAPADCVRLAR